MKSRSDDLEIFLQVATHQGFSAAAQALEMPVAKVSRAVQRLEARLQTTLLMRTTRQVSLTAEGAIFAQQVRKGLDQLQFAENQLIDQREKPKGLLRLDAASPFMLHQIVRHIGDFRQLYPDITLDLVTSEGIIDLIERRTDLAIRVGPLENSSLTRHLLGMSPLYIVGAPAYFARNGRPETMEDLKAHTLLGFSAPARLNIWPFGAGQGVEVTPTLQTNSGEILRSLCLEGTGLACLSHFMIAQDLKEGRLEAVLHHYAIEEHPRMAINAVYYKNTAVSSRIRAFLDFIKPKIAL